jgi:hypothetical protein
VLAAMRIDARGQPYLCTDATGVLVQAPERCRRGHFWVLVAPGKHVLFEFSERHDARAVDQLLGIRSANRVGHLARSVRAGRRGKRSARARRRQ